MQIEPERVDPYLNHPAPTGPPVPMPVSGWRILGFGAHENVARTVQDNLRKAGLRATAIAVSDDEASDIRLRAALADSTFDGIAIGGFINGQDPLAPATERTSLWFNRVLNIVHASAPTAQIILVRGPVDALAAIDRVLGDPQPADLTGAATPST